MDDPCRCLLSDLGSDGDGGQAWLSAIYSRQARLGCATLEIECAGGPLPAGFIAILGQAERELNRKGALLFLTGVSEESRLALRHARLEDLAGGESGGQPPGQEPFQVRFDEDGAVTISVSRDASQNPRMTSNDSHHWLQGVSCSRLEIDLGLLNHVNSVLVAWILQLDHVAKPAGTDLRNLSRQVAIQLNRLRLNHVMGMHEAT